MLLTLCLFQEFKLSLQDDVYRLQQLFCAIANADHPFANFMCGETIQCVGICIYVMLFTCVLLRRLTKGLSALSHLINIYITSTSML